MKRILPFLFFIILSGAHAQLSGITIAHHDYWQREKQFLANPRLYLKAFSKTFSEVRYMDEPGMIDPQTVGLNADIKETISLVKLASDLGFREVSIAFNWQKAGCINGTPYYYSSTDIASNFALISKALKNYPFVIEFNDIDLAQTLTATPTLEQAKDPKWISAHLTDLHWVSNEETSVLVRVAKQIMGACWKVNPKQRFIWQNKNVPLDMPSSLVETAENAYVPAAMQDVQGLSWPMTDTARDQVLRAKGYVVPPWQEVTYTTEGLYAYFKAHPCDVVTEAGLPPTTSWETRMAWLRSASSALERLGRRGRNFFFPEVYGEKGPNVRALDDIQQAIGSKMSAAKR